MKNIILILILILLFSCSNNTVSIEQWKPDVTKTDMAQDSFIETQKDIEDQDLENELANYDSLVETKQDIDQILDSFSDEYISPEDIDIKDLFDIIEDKLEQDTYVDNYVDNYEIKKVCEDEDGDGFGKYCKLGNDCDDKNPNFNLFCPDCSGGNVFGCSCSGINAPCYSGDPKWVGLGICKAGMQVCKDGFWSECLNEIMPSAETCDLLDNDCDGLTDENVKSSCGNCDLLCHKQSVGSALENKFELNPDNSSGVNINEEGNVVLDLQKNTTKFFNIWISNSPQNTVSKLDTKTGWEVGRYYVCKDPSRTSVDLQGNVYVACRGDGRVTKIISLKKNCIDKNNNGTIETSEDKNASKTITPDEMVQDDECIKFIVQPGGSPSAARGTGVDKENHVWIGKYDNKLYRLEPENGQVVDSYNIGVGSYGLTIDQKGMIWIQGGQLIRFDPYTHTKSTHGSAPGGQYGIAVDKFGKIWIGSYGSGAARYDPLNGSWQQVPGVPQASGIAATNDGYVWTSNDGCGCVSKIDATQMKYLGSVKVGGSPHGIAIDFDGFVWGVNWGGNTASKVDPIKMVMVGDYPVGNNPYTYSDMIGSSANWFAAPKGFYLYTVVGYSSSGSVRQDSSKHLWQKIVIDATIPEKTSLKLKMRISDSLLTLENQKWSEQVSFPPEVFPFDISSYNYISKILQLEIQLVTSENELTPTIKSVSIFSKTL